MLRRLYLAYITVGRTFGVWLSSLTTLFLFCVLWMAVSLGLMLDHLFFPTLRRKRIKSPIVIIGNPRTGTTFLQRFLVENGFGAGMQLWRLLCPSLTLQTIVKPFLRLLERLNPARYHSSAAHETGLELVEADDPSQLFRFCDGFFLYGFLLAWAEEDCRQEFDPRLHDTSRRDFRLYRAMWRRNLVATREETVVAKSFSLALTVRRFLEEFPDARILYLVRDPMYAVPSAMSLVTGVLEQRFGFWQLREPARRRYLERLYDALLELTRRFHEDYTLGLIPADRLLILRYDRLMRDFDNLMDDILAFLQVEAVDSLRREIKRTAQQQRKYVSRHQYDLRAFGLEEERIRRDYGFVYRDFLHGVGGRLGHGSSSFGE